MEFISDLFRFVVERKKFFLIPMVIALLLIGSIIVLSSGSAIAPFIYTVF